MCAILAALIFVPVGALILSALTGISVEIAFVIFILFAAVLVYLMIAGDKKNKIYKSKTIDAIKSIQGYDIKDIYVNDDSTAVLAISENPPSLLIGSVVKEKELDNKELKVAVNLNYLKIDDIIDFDVIINNKGMFSANTTTNTLGMAAVGGALFGSTGAIVGAIAGANDKSKVKLVMLQLVVNSIEKPSVSFVFYNGKVDSHTLTPTLYVEIATKWYNMVKILKHRKETGLQ